MPFRDNATHLRDIVAAIDLVETFVRNLSLDAYKVDLLHKSAVERQLQIITEAAVRLGKDAEILCPDVNWSGARGMGNFLRHAYQDVDDDIVWDAVKNDLPKLKESAVKAVRNLPPEDAS